MAGDENTDLRAVKQMEEQIFALQHKGALCRLCG